MNIKSQTRLRRFINGFIRFCNRNFIDQNDPLIPLVDYVPFRTDSELEKLTVDYAEIRRILVVETLGGDGREGKRYKTAFENARQIEREHGESLRKYLAPYSCLNNLDVSATEHHRWFASSIITSPITKDSGS